MPSKWRWKLLQLSRRLWVRASLIGSLGVVAALLAAIGERFIPWQLTRTIGADAVGDVLNIIASSMLAVTTFSLSVMVAAFSAATNTVTPRATTLLMQDRVTQNVLATFIGSFLFALVGIVMLKTGFYGDRGRAILFLATLAVIALIVVTLIRWIDHLSRLGRVGETTDRIEQVTRDAIEGRLRAPLLGGNRFDLAEGPPAGACLVTAHEVGYVQHIDVAGLADCADEMSADIYVGALPGTFVHPARPLVWINPPGQAQEDLCDRARKCFAIGVERSFDQDPRFGLAVLSEIATGALAPAVGDSGTAIDVIGRLTRLLFIWADGCTGQDESEVKHCRLHVPPIETADLFDDAFNLIARDGASLIEVQLRLQKALQALSGGGDAAFQACARRQAALALERALDAMTAPQDRARISAVATAGG